MRLNPQLLRTARVASLGFPTESKETKSGQALLIAILAASDSLLERRLSFWESMSEYNPLGQFFAAHYRTPR